MDPCQYRRIFVSIAIGLASATLCWLAVTAHGESVTAFGLRFLGADFGWSYNAAHEFMSGLDPYRHPPAIEYGPYPFPAVLFAIPFLVFTPTFASALFFGLSSALMAYGVTKEGWTNLLVFTCCPYWIALQWAQWTPLIFASAFFPVLAFTVCIKPHIALPIALTRLKKVTVLSAFALLAVSLVVYPSWPLHWLKGLGGYQSYWAFLTIPGVLLLLALKRWRDPDAKFLLLTSLFPQRWFYDALILWLIPKTRKELFYTSAFSWLAYVWLILLQPQDILGRSTVCVMAFHLPMLVTILRRPQVSHDHTEKGPICETATQPKVFVLGAVAKDCHEG